jgi:hypothetical protein
MWNHPNGRRFEIGVIILVILGLAFLWFTA